MGKSEQYYQDAEELYVRQLKSVPQIARILPVSQTTLYKWSEEGEWERKRRDYLKGPKGALELAEELLADMLKKLREKPVEKLSPRDIDKLAKVAKTVQGLKKSYDPYEIAVLFGSEFVPWVNTVVKDEGLRNQIFDLYNSYVEYVRARET